MVGIVGLLFWVVTWMQLTASSLLEAAAVLAGEERAT